MFKFLVIKESFVYNSFMCCGLLRVWHWLTQQPNNTNCFVFVKSVTWLTNYALSLKHPQLVEVQCRPLPTYTKQWEETVYAQLITHSQICKESRPMVISLLKQIAVS